MIITSFKNKEKYCLRKKRKFVKESEIKLNLYNQGMKFIDDVMFISEDNFFSSEFDVLALADSLNDNPTTLVTETITNSNDKPTNLSSFDANIYSTENINMQENNLVSSAFSNTTSTVSNSTENITMPENENLIVSSSVDALNTLNPTLTTSINNNLEISKLR